jgi:hypothetical protein
MAMLGSWLALLALPLQTRGQTGGADQLQQRVAQLVDQLDAPLLSDRQAARERLLELGQQVLPWLLQADEARSDEQRRGVLELLDLIERPWVTGRVGSQITLGGELELQEVLEAIERQSGNRVVTFPPGGERSVRPVALDRIEFWDALDQLASVYGRELRHVPSLSLQPTSGRLAADARPVTTSGPFRLELLRVTAVSDLTRPIDRQLQLRLLIAWEPRLSPVFLQLASQSLSGQLADGQTLLPWQPQATAELMPRRGQHWVETELRLLLPETPHRRAQHVSGELLVALPGQPLEVEFPLPADGRLEPGRPLRGERGKLSVELEEIAWPTADSLELKLAATLQGGGGSVESFRGWLLKNEIFLVGPDGQRIEATEQRTYRFRDGEAGVACRFPVTLPLDGFRLHYLAVEEVSELRFPFTLSDFPLP